MVKGDDRRMESSDTDGQNEEECKKDWRDDTSFTGFAGLLLVVVAQFSL